VFADEEIDAVNHDQRSFTTQVIEVPMSGFVP
jgi:hypothetical protein